MILDEATANVDTQTDAEVQKTLQTTFSDCTILVIAHRLSTIMECERVMVLEEGKVTIGVANIVGPDTVANILISFLVFCCRHF